MPNTVESKFEPRRHPDAPDEIRHYHRVGAEECHYNGYLLSGARLIQYVSDANAELNIRSDGVGGLFASIKTADFLESVYAGEVLEIIVRRVHKGNRSRHHEFEIYKHVVKRFDIGRSAAEPLDPPLLVARGSTISVIPKTSEA